MIWHECKIQDTRSHNKTTWDPSSTRSSYKHRRQDLGSTWSLRKCKCSKQHPSRSCMLNPVYPLYPSHCPPPPPKKKKNITGSFRRSINIASWMIEDPPKSVSIFWKFVALSHIWHDATIFAWITSINNILQCHLKCIIATNWINMSLALLFTQQ